MEQPRSMGANQGEDKMKPTKPFKNRKVSLKFMDISVSLEGKKNVEGKALSLLGAMLRDRMRVLEVMDNMEHEEDDAELKHGEKKIKAHAIIKPDVMYQ